MTALDRQGGVLEKICKTAIAQRLGDISGLPKELVEYIWNVYRKFISAYLNMLRQKENKPADWTPETLVVDSELTDGMKHFYSDYQHLTKEFFRLNQSIDSLQEIDRERQPNFYQHMVAEILKRCDQ
jgi:hypothetical protein